MKVYIPFNIVIDTDFGILRFAEKYKNIPAYSVNKIKSFLINRELENPIPEYYELRKVEQDDFDLYQYLLEKFYDSVLKLSKPTDILSFVINTYKLGLSNELEITIGCNFETEINFLKSILSSLKYSVNTELNLNINLNDYGYIFTKCLDEYYIDYLVNNNIAGKKLYVADYKFNTIVDPESDISIIDPKLHMRLESEGFVVSTVSIYNKKQ